MITRIPTINYFLPSEGRGGGGWDDHEGDSQLADQFNQALRLQMVRKLSTPNPFGLGTFAQAVSDRTHQAGSYILLSSELQPTARRLMELGPSDRINPVVIEHKFSDYSF